MNLLNYIKSWDQTIANLFTNPLQVTSALNQP